VISGFLAAIAAKKIIEGKATPFNFLAPRLNRIYTVFIFSLITAALVIPIFIGGLSYLKSHSLEFNFFEYSTLEWIKIITLTRVFDAENWELYRAFLPINGVYWFISQIIQIYIFIFAALNFKKYFKTIVCVGALMSLATLTTSGHESIPYGFFLPNFCKFFFGMAAYWIFESYPPRPSLGLKFASLVTISIAILFGVYIENEWLLRPSWAISIAFLIYCASAFDESLSKNIILIFFSKIGAFSFSVYLLHAPLIPLSDMISRNIAGKNHIIFSSILSICMTFMFCWIWSRFFEILGSFKKSLQSLKHPLKTLKPD